MRLRVVALPHGLNNTNPPYMLVMDRIPESEFPDQPDLNMQQFGEHLKEASGGQCHGLLMVRGELDIE